MKFYLIRGYKRGLEFKSRWFFTSLESEAVNLFSYFYNDIFFDSIQCTQIEDFKSLFAMPSDNLKTVLSSLDCRDNSLIDALKAHVLENPDLLLLKVMPDYIINDKEIAEKLCLKHGNFYLEYIGEEVKRDKKFVLSLLRKNIDVTSDFARQYLEKEDYLNAVKTDGRLYQYAPECYKYDIDFAIAAINSKYNAGLAYIYLPISFQEDKNIALKALSLDVNIYEHLPARFKKDDNVINILIDGVLAKKYNSSLLSSFFDPNDSTRYDLLLSNVSVSDWKFGSSWCSNVNFMLAAVKSNSMFLQFGDEEIRKNKEIAKIAYISNNIVFNFFDDSLKLDDAFIKECAIFDSSIYDFVWNYKKTFKTIETEKTNVNISSIKNADIALRNNYTFVIDAVSSNGEALKFASEEFKDNDVVVLKAVSNKGIAIRFASQRLKDEKEIGLVAVANNGLVLRFLSQKLRADKDIALTAVSSNGLALEYVDKKYWTNKEIALAAIANNEQAYKFVAKPLCRDITFLKEAINANPFVFKLLDDFFQHNGELYNLAKEGIKQKISI